MFNNQNTCELFFEDFLGERVITSIQSAVQGGSALNAVHKKYNKKLNNFKSCEKLNTFCVIQNKTATEDTLTTLHTF